MGERIFLWFTDLLIPLLMVGCGWWMWKRPPKEINDWVGYRTTRSKKNAATWRFAHETCGKLWWKMGWLSLIPSIPAAVCSARAEETTMAAATLILCTLQTGLLILSIYLTEKALKKTFDP